jgi:uncharacterized protein (DUF2147 family)
LDTTARAIIGGLMRARTLVSGCLTLLLFCAAEAPSDQLDGLWFNQERDAKLQVYQTGDTFEAKIVWLKEPTADGKPKVDKNNPDPALRERPTLGLVILRGLHSTEDPNVYKGGRIYDPKNGKTYDCRVIFKGDTLELRGFVLGLPFLGRTAIWSKAD